MTAVGAKSVGRVSIRVLPDSSKFREDLQKALTRVERTMSVKVPVDANVDRAKVTLNRLVKDYAGKKVELNAGVDTGVASARIAAVARPRVVPLNVEVAKASLARAGTVLASLSGARLAGDAVQRLSSSLQNLDRSLPRLAAAGLGIASLVSVLLSSIGGLLTVGAGLASIAGAALALPGILAGAAVGATVFAVALAGAKDQLSDLAPAFEGLKNLIQENFWSEARQPILDLVNGLLPQLEAGLGRTASALGVWTTSLSSGFQQAFGGGVLERMIDRLNESILIASGGTAAFAGSIGILGSVGSSYLPRLAAWARDLAIGFENWLAILDDQGRLTGFIDAGIIALGQLGAVLANTGSILQGLFVAADAAGGGGLASLAAVLGEVAEIVNGPAFQGTLTTLFAGAAAGAAGLAAALGPIGQLIGALAPTLSSALAGFGQLAGLLGGLLGGQLAAALSSPAFTSGFGVFLGGLQAGIQALLPALPSLAGLLGSVAQFAGVLAATLGPVLGSVITALAPIVGELLTALQPLLPVLGDGLLTLVQAIAPLLAGLAPIFGILVSAVVGLIGPLVGLVTPLLELLMPLVQLILPLLANLLTPVIALVGGLLQAFAPLITALIPLVTSLLPPLLQIFTAFAPLLGLVAQVIVQLLTIAIDPLIKTIGFLVPLISGVASGLASVLVPAINMITNVLGGLIDFVTGVFSGDWDRAWAGIVRVFSGIWDGIGNIAKGALNGVIDIVNGLIGSVNGVTGAIGIPAIPKIPKLAMGADVLPTPGGTAVILGEGGRRESVVDYGNMNRLIQLTSGMIERNPGGSPADIDVNITTMQNEDPRILARAVGRELNNVMAGR
ncbi:hypothetical protein [Herbiconiux sp. L3-i23]|uniref:phage tail protein n=1 Tax=Herbiconiux sp. L3-i23 TaxID=2905871 RepID=UPI002052B33A|nr:hypothetical protein [Herbiconiux sp. L3-i23]BDI23536.1 hypothetical protein L3i23_23120 [Herbiconiux sp. L3-i23]